MFLDLFGIDDGGAAVGAGAAYGAAYFGVMGAGVGFFIKEDRWENIPLPNTFLSARPARFDLGISIPVRW
jgi:hypothetical protein